MHLKARIARWISSRVETRARSRRRALRDRQREEWNVIHSLEKRSRGLRLYAAWSRACPSNIVRPAKREWNALPQAA